MNTKAMPFGALAALLVWRGAAFAMDKRALLEHLRESYNFPSGVQAILGEPVPSEIEGFDVMSLRLSMGGAAGQDQKLYVSKDGRFYLLGAFKDLSKHPDQERLKKVDLSKAPARGKRNAPVVLVEYTDFQCPYCQRGYEIVRHQIMKDFSDKVRWLYKALPLRSIHPWAEPAAVAVACAHQQGEDKFWVLHDALFEKQREISQRNFDDKLKEFIKAAKIDEKRFQACYENKATQDVVSKDLAEAGQLDINGTPAFLVNGHLVSGADYDGLKRVIQEALQGEHGKP